MAKKVKDVAAVNFEAAYYKGKWIYVPVPHAPTTQMKQVAEKQLRSDLLSEAKIIDPKEMSTRELRALCKTNGISYYWVTGKTESMGKIKVYNAPRKAVERENVPLSPDEFEKFITQLTAINKISGLIADILWSLNEQLQDTGAFVTLEEVLRLKCWEVCRHKKMLILLRSAHGRDEMVSLELPKGIFNKVLSLINDNSIFVFSNRKGGPLSHRRITSHFQLAGAQAELRILCKGFTVTPRLLRPVHDPSSKEAIAYRKSCQIQSIHVNEMQLDELLQHLPKPKKNAGAKSTYGQKAHLRAIIYLMQAGCQWNELPHGSPPSDAVESQFRRWEKAGFIKKVEEFLAV